MRGSIFDFNSLNIITSSIRDSWCGFPCLFSELLYFLLMLDKGPTYLMSLLKRNVLGVGSIFLTRHGCWWGESGEKDGGRGSTGVLEVAHTKKLVKMGGARLCSVAWVVMPNF